MLPGDMVSESPVTPALTSCGSPQSGPCTRGNSRKSTSAIGAAWPTSNATVRRLSRAPRTGAARRTSVAVICTSATAISSAVGMVCV